MKKKRYTKQLRGEIIDQHLTAHGNEFDEDVFVSEASDPDHPAHDYFCWDRDKNHQNSLRRQARRFINDVEIKYVGDRARKVIEIGEIVIANPEVTGDIPALIAKDRKRVYVETVDHPDAMLAELRNATIGNLSDRKRAMFTVLGLDYCIRRLELNLKDIQALIAKTADD